MATRDLIDDAQAATGLPDVTDTTEALASPGPAPAPRSASAEWAAHWPMVLSAMTGMSVYAMITYSFGQFIEPIEQEFHWSRAGISGGIAVFNVVAGLMGPVMGMAVDRFGARRVGVPGIVATSLAFAALSLTSANIATWYGLWLLLALMAVAIKSTVWSAAVSRQFTTSRGLALSAMLCGSAIAQALAQVLPNLLIAQHGWRAAYVWIAAGWGGLAAVLIVLFFHDAPRARRVIAPAPPAASLPGLTFREAFRSPAILRIALANLCVSAAGSGITVHMMPLLTQTGLSRLHAAEIAATAGISGIAGKLITGWLLDRVRGNLVPYTSLAICGLGYLLLTDTLHAPAALTVGVMVLGYGAGAGLQASTYLISRYAGLKAFGAIFGLIASMLYVGTSIGAWLAGAVHDATGSYNPLLWTAAPVVFIAALLMIGLGAYPDFKDRPAP